MGRTSRMLWRFGASRGDSGAVLTRTLAAKFQTRSNSIFVGCGCVARELLKGCDQQEYGVGRFFSSCVNLVFCGFVQPSAARSDSERVRCAWSKSFNPLQPTSWEALP